MGAEEVSEETRTKMVVIEMACSCGARFWCEFPVSVAPYYGGEFIGIAKTWSAAHGAHKKESEKAT